MPKSVRLSFPSSARIHLPVHWTSGIVIDETMPVGARYPQGEKPLQLVYQFVVVENAETSGSASAVSGGASDGGGIEVSARSTDELVGPDLGGGVSVGLVARQRCTASVERNGEGFVLTFSSPTDVEPSVRDIPSIDAVAEDQCAWLRQTYGVQTLHSRIESGDQPAWVTAVPMVFTFDLWRSSREVAHTYTHLRDLVGELHDLGVPTKTLFYLTGWCGPFDAWYPSYEPTLELGGRNAFAEAIRALHEAGYRAMVHAHPRDADPYRPGIEKLLRLAVRRYPKPPGLDFRPRHLTVPPPSEAPLPPVEHSHLNKPPHDGPIPPAPPDDPLRGPYWGWPGGGEREWIGFDSAHVIIPELHPTAGGWMFETVEVPKSCEAVFTLGGLSGVGHGTVQITVNGRSLTTPGGWFLDKDSYEFPFTLMFHPGVNLMEIACFGWPANQGGVSYGPQPDLDGPWYQISQAYHHPGPWTSPKVAMDTDSPEWHQINTRLLAESMAEFEIDGVHIDSTVLWRWDDRGYFPYLKRHLPEGSVFGTEVASAPSLGYFAFCQTGPYKGETVGEWTPAQSDLPHRISQRYQRYYLHLCNAYGFVPVGSVCDVDPIKDALRSEEIKRTEDSLRFARERNLLYTLRVNYRDHGLDEGTKEFLRNHVIGRS